MVIERVGEADLDDLLPLFRGYLDFYGTAPSDEDVLKLCRVLIADPEREGLQLIAREDGPARPRAIGFATLFWGWSSTKAVRAATMNDLFVAEHARGSGCADRLIAACADAARAGGAAVLDWVTAPDNHRAQKVYDRTGAEWSEWVEYGLRL